MRRRWLITATAVGLMAVAVGAACSEAGPASGGGAGVRVDHFEDDYGSGLVSVTVTTLPAPELPDGRSEAGGVLVRREDNSLFVGTGSISVNVQVTETAGGTLEPNVSIDHTGPVVEVVVTHDTLIYREETEMPDIGPGALKPGEHELTVQQVVEQVDSLDELEKTSELEAWGRRSGDRVVADVVVFRTADLGI